VAGVQLGYESRCAPPHAFDVMLGSQLGIGAYRALVEENLDGHMVSTVFGQLDLQLRALHTSW
jgi:6-phosphofructokinase